MVLVVCFEVQNQKYENIFLPWLLLDFHIFLLFSSVHGMEWECHVIPRVLQLRNCDNSLLVYYQSDLHQPQLTPLAADWAGRCHLLYRRSSGREVSSSLQTVQWSKGSNICNRPNLIVPSELKLL